MISLTVNGQEQGEKFMTAVCILDYYDIKNESQDGTVKAYKYFKGDSLYCGIKNYTNDTIYFYGTTYIENLMYNKEIIRYSKKRLFIDLSIKVPHPLTYYSGFKQYQLYILPSLTGKEIAISLTDIQKVVGGHVNEYSNIVIVLSYIDSVRIVFKDQNDILVGWIKKGKNIIAW